MTKTNEFAQPIQNFGGTYGQVSWPGYIHKQVRVEGGRHIGDSNISLNGYHEPDIIDLFDAVSGDMIRIKLLGYSNPNSFDYGQYDER